MTRQLVAMKLKVQCSDGSMHQDVSLFVEDRRKIYIDSEGKEIGNVSKIEECVAVVPPNLLTPILFACKE